jgi:hypothetical protein
MFLVTSGRDAPQVRYAHREYLDLANARVGPTSASAARLTGPRLTPMTGNQPSRQNGRGPQLSVGDHNLHNRISGRRSREPAKNADRGIPGVRRSGTERICRCDPVRLYWPLVATCPIRLPDGQNPNRRNARITGPISASPSERQRRGSLPYGCAISHCAPGEQWPPSP